MKWIERVWLGILLVGVLFKIMHYPGGGILLIISIMVLSSLYSYFGFLLFNGIRLRDIFKKKAYSNATTWAILGAVYMGSAMSVMLLGILFRVQYYPGATVMLLTGVLFLGLGIGVYIIKLTVSGSHFVVYNWYRVLPVFLVGSGFVFYTYSDSYKKDLQERDLMQEQNRLHQEQMYRNYKNKDLRDPDQGEEYWIDEAPTDLEEE